MARPRNPVFPAAAQGLVVACGFRRPSRLYISLFARLSLVEGRSFMASAAAQARACKIGGSMHVQRASATAAEKCAHYGLCKWPMRFGKLYAAARARARLRSSFLGSLMQRDSRHFGHERLIGSDYKCGYESLQGRMGERGMVRPEWKLIKTKSADSRVTVSE